MGHAFGRLSASTTWHEDRIKLLAVSVREQQARLERRLDAKHKRNCGGALNELLEIESMIGRMKEAEQSVDALNEGQHMRLLLELRNHQVTLTNGVIAACKR